MLCLEMGDSLTAIFENPYARLSVQRIMNLEYGNKIFPHGIIYCQMLFFYAFKE